MRNVLLIASILLAFPAIELVAAEAQLARPNILWIVCEDAHKNWFGCYGNAEAHTPNVDGLAKQGFRYTHAIACAPVCAPSRSTWITGINAVSMGTQAMRSRYAIPHDLIRYYPDELRRAGYYTANHSKTDFNIGGRPDGDCWDSNTATAWKSRKPGQPFFQIINLGDSHESSAHGNVTQTTHSPQNVTLAKYHPEELAIRQNYAKYYDAIEKTDAAVGKVLRDLAEAGLADDTIVIFNSDHAGVLPRSKRFLFDSGVRCPLIVRIPEKFKPLWPAQQPGTTIDRLVSFIDMPKTWLSLADAKVPDTMQGSTFLGPRTEPEPPYVFSFRDRMDERFDCQRAVRDKRFAYIKNYMPYLPWGQHVEYLWKMEATKAWDKAHREGRTNAVTGRFFELKPNEELYDMEADPDNVVNLAERPEHQQTLATMRGKLREWQLKIYDSGLLPEAERQRRATENKTTVYQMVRDAKLYNLPAYLDAADLALARKPENKTQLLAALNNADAALRYWGTVGLHILGKPDTETRTALAGVLNDDCHEVACMASWILLQAGETTKPHAALTTVLKSQSPATIFALNVLDWSKTDIAPFAAELDTLADSKGSMSEYEKRLVEHLRPGKPIVRQKKK